MMENIQQYLLWLHIAAGFTSLILFWLPVFTRKGGNSHRKIGKVYVKLMWVVLVTSGLLSVINVYLGNYSIAIFLGYLTLITSNPLWYGIAILDNKKKLSDRYRKMHFSFNGVVFATGLTLLIYGLTIDEGVGILMIIFGSLGTITGWQIYRDYRNGLSLSWFQTHYKGMITTAIAGYTAFFAFGARQFLETLLSGYWQIVPWVLPTIVGTIAMQWMDRHYFRKGVVKKEKLELA